jgi:hypothetical protein
MAMYLAGIPVFTIMLIGCWSSDAFLCYIQLQVQQFSYGISNCMITSPDFFKSDSQVLEKSLESLDMSETLLHVPTLALMQSALHNNFPLSASTIKWSEPS